MTRKLLLLIGYLFSAVALLAQVSFTASTNAKQVTTYSYFEVKFVLNNARPEAFTPPSFSGLEVISGPSRSTSTTIINGVYSSESSFGFVLQAEKAGKITIGSATVKVDGKTLRTEPLTIEVVDGKKMDKKGGKAEEIFLAAEIPVKEIYVGQQIPLDYKIYTLTDINSFNILTESDYQGFYAEDVRRFESSIVSEVINGKQYTTKVLKRLALFPQQTGQLIIEPMRMQLGISQGAPSNPRDFFFSPELIRLDVASEPLEVTIKSLPEGAPTSFTGAVGMYSFASFVQNTRVSTDDGLPIRVSVNGNGDMKRVSPPVLDLGDAFEVYEPKVLEERTQEIDGEIQTRRVYEYIALPKMPGDYNIKIEFSYFDPKQEIYQTIYSEPTLVTVVKGLNTVAARRSSSTASKVEDDIRFIKTQATLRKQSTIFFHTPLFWTGLGLPFLLLGALGMMKNRQQQRSLIAPGVLKNKQAQKVAQKHLSQAKQYLDSQNSRQFFDAISKAMLGYVNDKLNISNAQLTKDNVAERLAILHVPSERIHQFMQLMNTCEMTLFARQDSPEAMHTVYSNTTDLLVNLEKEILDN